MNALITGGTGFIGSRLALRCLHDGHTVRVLGQENNPAEADNRKWIEDRGAEVVLGSVTDSSLVDDLVRDIDTVFHLAATQHEMNVPDQRFQDVNVAGTRIVLEASVAAHVTRFVHGSTIGVYGVPHGVIDEETPPEPDNIYGVTKLEGERVVLGYQDRLPVGVIRIPEVYGPGDRRLLKLFKALGAKFFFMIGRGENLHHLIYIDDLIDGFLSAAATERAVGEIILLAGKEPATTNQMVAAIAAVFDKRPPRLHAPLWLFVALATVMELGLRPLGIQPPLHRRRLDFFRKSFTLSTAKAHRLLGFSSKVAFAEGARRTAEWYESVGLVPRLTHRTVAS